MEICDSLDKEFKMAVFLFCFVFHLFLLVGGGEYM